MYDEISRLEGGLVLSRCNWVCCHTGPIWPVRLWQRYTSLCGPVHTQAQEQQTKRLQGKLQQSKLLRLSSSSSRLTVWLQTLRDESEHSEPISSYRHHLSLRTTVQTGRECRERHWLGTENRSDWIFTNPDTEAWWEIWLGNWTHILIGWFVWADILVHFWHFI